MSKFETILRHFNLSKKLIKRTTDEKTTKNARTNDTKKVKQPTFSGS